MLDEDLEISDNRLELILKQVFENRQIYEGRVMKKTQNQIG